MSEYERAVIANTRQAARHPWPPDCYVQGGDRGVVFTGGQPYQTAFVEAFPPGTFLRGEGPTVTAAEDACWKQYQVMAGCPHDQGFERREYVNGCGHCRRCGTWFDSTVTGFAPLPEYYAARGRPSLMERAIAGDKDAAAEVIGLIARAGELPGKDAGDEGRPS